MAFLLEFIYLDIAFMASIVGVALYIFHHVSKAAERSSEREHEIRKLQFQERLHVSNPRLFAELDRLQRQFSLIAMGIRGGWIPFVMMFLHTMNQARIAVDGKTDEYKAWVPPVAIVVGLVVFYAFLFNRAIRITAKMKETESEIIVNAQKNSG